MKSKPHTNIDGQDLISISKLPYHQAIQVSEWLSEPSFIEGSLNTKTEVEMISYDDYEYWYDCFFEEEKFYEDYDELI
ncbi:hypothetical protein [Aureibacter tunicatorum]|uniref:Uncharacterized protein n=1 Tax=Aureibacter tunicatorum TaxID=866807 RepID=A0AAE3XI75_9BACT|nr:hypothetical protein [Aureibacter tunicatorum]MDR6237303.1 hypothetical protein [Aureibacter tunicatorum]BDD06294.1 hypothetical protein AUTU_37770 [Aureibacter tunicatorum]